MSGLRWFIFDRFLVPKVKIDHRSRRDKDTEAAYQALVANHYQFLHYSYLGLSRRVLAG